MTDKDGVRQVEEVVSAWAFAHDIDGAARNDLFARLREAQAIGQTDGPRYVKAEGDGRVDGRWVWPGQTDDAVVTDAMIKAGERAYAARRYENASTFVEDIYLAMRAAMPTGQTNRLEEALIEARNTIILMAHNGVDFSRHERGLKAATKIDAALAQTTDDRHGPQPPVEGD